MGAGSVPYSLSLTHVHKKKKKTHIYYKDTHTHTLIKIVHDNKKQANIEHYNILLAKLTG